MARAAVEVLVYLLDEAFEGDEEHSLLGNLRHVREEDWRWKPEAGVRSIRAIAAHAGAAKYLYENHAFGDASYSWDAVFATELPDRSACIDWLREGQARLRASIAALDDGELPRPRKTHWGEMYETRRLIGVVIEHDLYHAGEINHLRALRQGDDRWPGQP